MAHVEAQFKPMWAALRAEHNRDLRRTQHEARQTHNSGALLPAEAACRQAHARSVILARAQCMADAYTAFGEAAGREANVELSGFYMTVVGGCKAAFQGAVGLRGLRAREPSTQMPFLLRGFEQAIRPALDEGLAVLDRQRVEIQNRPKVILPTKYVVDTSVFNWLADSRTKLADLPKDGGFAITHIQLDEINNTRDDERRVRLLIMQSLLRCELIPTHTFVLDVSRLDHAGLGNGDLFSSLRNELDALNGGKANNVRDALIGEAAIANKLTLLTADADLGTVVEKYGGAVVAFRRPRG
jgi:hypothetical protein